MVQNSAGATPWRVGVLFSQTGATAVIERCQLKGTLLAIKELNEAGGVDGRPIEPVIYDPASQPDRFRQLAVRLLADDGVNVIFGCYMSHTRKAVMPVVEKRHAILFYPTLYEGFEYSANVIYGGAVPNQNSVPLASYLMDHFGKRFYFVGSDYIYPRESSRIMAYLIKQRKGEVVGQAYVPVEADEHSFDAVAADIRRKQPDVIFSTVVGAGTAHFYRAYARSGGDAERVPIASLTTTEAEVAEMGNEVAYGHITAAPYFETIDTPANRRFKEGYYAAFGAQDPVTHCCEAAYFLMHLFGDALLRCGTVDADVLRRALLGAEFDAPQGRVKIDPDNNHTYLVPRIARVDEQGTFKILTEAEERIKPDPYLVCPALDDWSIRLRQADDSSKQEQ